MNISLQEWKEFFKTKKSVLFLFALAIVSSTLYVIYLKHTEQLSTGTLQQYLMHSETKFEMRHFISVFGVYFKRCMLVWIMGLFVFMTPLCFGLVFLYIFSYGFSIASLYICFGMKGILMGLLTFGVQCILMVSYLLHLEACILKKNQVFGEMERKIYPTFILLGAGVALAATLGESLIMLI